MSSKGNPYKHKGGGGTHRVADRAALIGAEFRPGMYDTTERDPIGQAERRAARRAKARARLAD